MPAKLLVPVVHKSHSYLIKKCSKQLELRYIHNLKPKSVSEAALAGSAFHKFAEEIYKSNRPEKWLDTMHWTNFWIEDFQRRKEEVIMNDQEVASVKDIKAEDFLEMINEFCKQPYNIHAEPILLETPFRFTITKGRTKYKFAGAIDQLLKIKWEHIPNYLKDKLYKLYAPEELNRRMNGKNYIYIHRDIKTGGRKDNDLNEINLTTDDNIMYYSYALLNGEFDIRGDGTYGYRPKLLPFAHALYYTRDHLTYKRKTGIHEVGDFKGPGMYFIKKNLNDIGRMETELINLHKKINNGIYTRDGVANSLCNFCGVKDSCLHDWQTSNTKGE